MWSGATAEISPDPRPATPSQAVWRRVFLCVGTLLTRNSHHGHGLRRAGRARSVTMRPGVRSARSGSKSVAGTTVEAHIVRPRARGRAARLRAFPSSLGRTAALSAGQHRADHDHGEKCRLSGQWLRSGPDRVACREDRDGPVAFRARCRGHAGSGALAAAGTRLGGRRGASVTRVSARPPPLALCEFPA